MNYNDLFCLKTINAIKCSLCHKEDLTEVFFPSLISITKEDINNTNLNEFLFKFKDLDLAPVHLVVMIHQNL